MGSTPVSPVAAGASCVGMWPPSPTEKAGCGLGGWGQPEQMDSWEVAPFPLTDPELQAAAGMLAGCRPPPSPGPCAPVFLGIPSVASQRLTQPFDYLSTCTINVPSLLVHRCSCFLLGVYSLCPVESPVWVQGGSPWLCPAGRAAVAVERHSPAVPWVPLLPLWLLWLRVWHWYLI